jgi:hypothetical protein
MIGLWDLPSANVLRQPSGGLIFCTVGILESSTFDVPIGTSMRQIIGKPPFALPTEKKSFLQVLAKENRINIAK